MYSATVNDASAVGSADDDMLQQILFNLLQEVYAAEGTEATDNDEANAAGASAHAHQAVDGNQCESGALEAHPQAEVENSSSRDRRQRDGEQKGGADAKSTEYVLCDFCNNIIVGDRAKHLEQDHADVAPLMEKLAAAAATATALSRPTNPQFVKFGESVYRAVAHADRGPATFAVIDRARAQLSALICGANTDNNVYLFGSCVSMGLWDGMGDADFTAYLPEEIHDDLGEPTRKTQSSLMLRFARRLREGGFLFEELDVVAHARVPIIRRKRDAKRPYELSHANEPYTVNIAFVNSPVSVRFHNSARVALEQTYGAVESKSTSKQSLRMAYEFSDGALALRFFARREPFNGITKSWKLHGRLPELFSVDFDLSCRSLGVRNSWFLRRYFAQNYLFRVGNLFIKEWSKKSGLNNSRRGFLTSYAVTNLWVYYLLRAGHASFVDPASIGAVPTVQEHGTVSYMPLWPHATAPRTGPSADCAADPQEVSAFSALGKLLYGFFEFYAVTFDWSREVVSLRDDCSSGDSATLLTKAEVGWTLADENDTVMLRDRVFYRICIEDVYEENLNLGRHLTAEKALWFLSQIRLGWEWCHSGGSPAPQSIPRFGERCADEAANAAKRSVEQQSVGGTSSEFSSLLDDGYLARIEETLRIQVRFVLLQQGGMASVRDLQRMISANHATELGHYELFHRLCDLWYDYDRIADDAKTNQENRRRMVADAAPRDPFAGDVARGDAWLPVSDTALLSPQPDRVSDSLDRIVFLANLQLMPELARAKRDRPLSTRQLNSLTSVAREAFRLTQEVSQRLNASESTRLFGVDVDELGSNVGAAFFTVDGIAFASYAAREHFKRHLRAVASAFENEATTKKVTAALAGHKRKDTGRLVAPIIAEYCREVGAKPLDEALIGNIFGSARYMTVDHATGNPQPTALLSTYMNKDHREEDVKRTRDPRRNTHPRGENNNGGGSRPVPIRRDTESRGRGHCTQCGKEAFIYATNQPAADSGKYCMACWDRY